MKVQFRGDLRGSNVEGGIVEILAVIIGLILCFGVFFAAGIITWVRDAPPLVKVILWMLIIIGVAYACIAGQNYSQL